MTPLQEIWVYLAERPLFALTLTLATWLGAQWIFERSGGRAWANPVLLSVLALSVFLLASRTEYATYFEGAQFIHFLLGPATVALAIPLYHQLGRIRRNAPAIAAGLATGSLLAVASTLILLALFGAGPLLLASLAPKSVTSPVAMALAEQLGGSPPLAAVHVILTGILGASFGPWLLDRLRIADEAARGLALGVAAHGIGTARALRESARCGAFAGLGMGLNALLTAAYLPFLGGLLSG